MPTSASTRTAAHSSGPPRGPRPDGAPAAGRGRLLARTPPWAYGLALAIPLAIAYLLLAPPSGDLAAATYRSDLFARAGFTIWDNGWYGGHALLDYSLISPALGHWVGLRLLIALSAVAGSALFGALCARTFPRPAAIAATLAFAFGLCTELPSGRVPYDLGAAIALAALLLFARGARWPLWAAAAVLASAASPVAGAFLGLAGLAVAVAAVAGEGLRPPGAPRGIRLPGPAARGLILCAVSLAPILLLAAAFGEGGFEPFTSGAFWPELLATTAVAAFLPRGPLPRRAWLALRIGAALYACALAGSFLLLTPVGSNAVRLGDLVGAPLVVAALWEWRRPRRQRPGTRTSEQPALREQNPPPSAAAPRRRQPAFKEILLRPSGRMLLAGLAPLLLYWQLATSINDQVALAGDRTVNASYYAPLRAELLKVAHGRPIRVEVPMSGAHWEAAYLPGGPITLARGWERQLDTRYAPLFYEIFKASITPSQYRAWLSRNAVSYVALTGARLDAAGKMEAQLIDRGLPYLREIWHSAHWRLFAVRDPVPLAQPPARLAAIGADAFTLTVPQAGSYEVRMRYTPYYAPTTGRACISRTPRGYVEVQAAAAGRIRLDADFSLGAVFSTGPRCHGAHARP